MSHPLAPPWPSPLPRLSPEAVAPGLSALSVAIFLGEHLPWHVLAGLAPVTVGIMFGVRQAAKRP